ncbi:MAG TPA: Gfo/Idh/MocA family oxidoreductase [Casimicrobiaceae bacterium]|nr:Gfo/Idh/MocA family oxidoreductase [Casimicrobiaceae bacterium]
MSSYTIVGAGFGLYGYLPALVETFRQPVLLPERYRSRLAARPELIRYESSIVWVKDTSAALAHCTGVVIATPPTTQPDIVTDAMNAVRIDTLILEKPLAATPQDAEKLLTALRRTGKRYRIGYTFLHTEWAKRLVVNDAESVRGISITWSFLAHHFRYDVRNWKRAHASGGGVLRFYAIHLLALLAKHGYDDVLECIVGGAESGDPERWFAVLSGSGLPPCRVVVESRSETSCFKIDVERASGTDRLLQLAEPFALEHAVGDKPELDRRTGVLSSVLRSLETDDDVCYRLYESVLSLWQAVESAAEFVIER